MALCYCYVCMSTLCLAIKNFVLEKPQRKWPVAVYYIRAQTDLMSRALVICFLKQAVAFFYFLQISSACYLSFMSNESKGC